MRRTGTSSLRKISLRVGIVLFLLGLGIMLLHFLQGRPFSVFSLTPVTIGVLAIAVGLRKQQRGPS